MTVRVIALTSRVGILPEHGVRAGCEFRGTRVAMNCTMSHHLSSLCNFLFEPFRGHIRISQVRLQVTFSLSSQCRDRCNIGQMNGTLAFVVALAVLVVAYYVRGLSDYKVPKWLSGHPVQFYEDLVPEDIARELREIMKERGVIYTNAADTNYYEPAYDNIGEAVPLVNDRCEGPLMMPNKNRTRVSFNVLVLS